MATTIDRREVKKAKPRSARVQAAEAFEIATKRYPVIIARLAR